MQLVKMYGKDGVIVMLNLALFTEVNIINMDKEYAGFKCRLGEDGPYAWIDVRFKDIRKMEIEGDSLIVRTIRNAWESYKAKAPSV